MLNVMEGNVLIILIFKIFTKFLNLKKLSVNYARYKIVNKWRKYPIKSNYDYDSNQY